MIKGEFNMKKIVFLLIISMIVISSISFVAAGSGDTNRVRIPYKPNDIQIVDYGEPNRRGYTYEQIKYMTHTQHSANSLTYDIDNDGNANFLIDDDKNFLICDYNNDGNVDFAVADYDNDGDLDIIKYP